MTGWLEAPYQPPRIGPLGWVRVVLRGGLLGGLTYGGLVLLLLLRLVEAPIFGPARPWTPHITRFVCRLAFPIMGLPLVITGTPMQKPGVVVANHASWLDIFALNAGQTIYFVAKSEVERWAAIGWLARATGTVFIARKGSEARVQRDLFERRLGQGHKLLFFPEGTSSDAIRVLSFKSTLFAALFTPGLRHDLCVQPVTVIYHPPAGQDPRFYGWWGTRDFAPHLIQVLAAPRQGRVEVIFHPEVPVQAFDDRKALSAYCERVIRTRHPLVGG